MPVDLLTLGAALLTGLLGGVHCVAMCGGIATGLAATSAKQGLGNALQAHASGPRPWRLHRESFAMR